MKYRLFAGAAAGVALFASTAAAQVCQGDLSFRSSPIHVAGNLGITNNTTAFGGGLDFGHPSGFYGGGSLGMMNFSGANGTGIVLGGGLGYSMPLAARSPWQVCPGGTLSLDFGPSQTVGGTTIHTSMQTFTLGASIGRSLPLNKTVSLLPFGEVALGHTTASASGGGVSASASDTYLVLGFGAGFQFSPSLVLRPSLQVLAGADLVDDTVFSLGVTWALPR
ncbi:MAG TPA: outer membrane beta-barrel protein [Gemmatimonadaceae bacterium]|nr:outer membrane beta-barrel protein [Gemmatimonadaceae bacterium]